MTGERLNRRPSFKDRFYIREWRGKQIVQAKPRRGRKELSERQQIAVDKFKQAAILAKTCAPSQQITADALTKNTQFFARDLIYMAMYGTLAAIQLDDGRKLFSVAANQNVSDLIDALAQRVGEMLFRNVDGWEPIPVGEPDDVLTFRDGRPQWLPASGGGGAGIRSIRLQRDTPGGAAAQWAQPIQWDASPFADWEGFNPAQPDLIPFPPDASRFRFDAYVTYPATSLQRNIFLRLQDQDGNNLDNLVGSFSYHKPSNGFASMTLPWSSGWAEIGDLEAVRLWQTAFSFSYDPEYQPGSYIVLSVV